MKDMHIIDLVDSKKHTRLSDSERSTISSHIERCVDCRKAYEAANIAAALLEEHASRIVEPSPFFQTRVLSGLREQQSVNSWGFGRLWRAAGPLASSMVATVIALVVLTFAVPDNPTVDSYSLSAYSAEEVILDQDAAMDFPASDGQVLTTLYDDELETTR